VTVLGFLLARLTVNMPRTTYTCLAITELGYTEVCMGCSIWATEKAKSAVHQIPVSPWTTHRSLYKSLLIQMPTDDVNLNGKRSVGALASEPSPKRSCIIDYTKKTPINLKVLPTVSWVWHLSLIHKDRDAVDVPSCSWASEQSSVMSVAVMS
jgi:hypothetical protein